MFAWKNHGRSIGPHRWLVERFAPRRVIQREYPGAWSSTFSGAHAVSHALNRTSLSLTTPSSLSTANDDQVKTDWIRTKASTTQYVLWLRTKTNWVRRNLHDYCRL